MSYPRQELETVKYPGTREQQVSTLFETLLETLRDVYRGGESVGRKRNKAVDELERLAEFAAISHETERTVELLLRKLRLLPPDPEERRADVQQIAESLKEIRPLLSTAPPDHEYGKLNSAIRQTKQDRERLKTAAAARPVRLEDPVSSLPRVGPKGAEQLEKMNVATVGGLLRHTPRDYIDYSNAASIGKLLNEPGQVVYRGTIRGIREIYGRGKSRVEATLRDATGMIPVTWFSTYVTKEFEEGDEVIIRGTVKSDRHGLQLSPIEWFKADSEQIANGHLIPIYPLTKGLTQKRLRMWTSTALELAKTNITDWLPEIAPVLERFRSQQPVVPLDVAYQQLHFPESPEALAAARDRMTFDVYLMLQIGLIQRKSETKAQLSAPMTIDIEANNRFRASLPFALTEAQQRATGEILADLRKPAPMTRLLQGDVGTGKTVVAAIAAFTAMTNGYQTALMAPTEILAEQHHRSFQRLFEALPEEMRPKIALLTGSTRASVRKEIDKGLQDGSISVLIGTHAIIEDRVKLQNLGLVIIDEQHRFGVHQRGLLLHKAHGIAPHTLSMTATPIPKTLNHVVHGDLDVSLIDQRPPGRVEIETMMFNSRDRRQAERLIRDEIAREHQVFVICPLVEDTSSDEFDPGDDKVRTRLDAKAAVNEADRLQREVFPDLKVDVIHGQMPSKKKDEVMTRFRDREFNILVATSVIEVGIDIPNATVIMIEGADRFGLSQLHQLRGRVGRGNNKSYCLLIAESASAVAWERLEAMMSTNDGFLLAQKDLEIRGPGDFIGTRQSGMPEMDWVGKGFDSRLLDRAHSIAEALLANPSKPLDQRYPQLSRHLADFWKSTDSLDTTKV